MSARDRVIEVARALFASAGYEASSIEEILRRAGVSRGALYHHFASKELLFEAVFVDIEQAIAQAAAAAAAGTADPERQLRAGCRVFLEEAGRSDIRQIILVDAPTVFGWARWRALEERFGFGLIKRGVHAVLKAKGVPLRTADARAHLLLAALIEAALLIAKADDPPAMARIGTGALDKAIDGLLG